MMTRLCTIEGCTAEHNARGYCKKHYARWWRWGDPLANHRPVHVVEHGTINEYGNYGCRCDECKAAAAKYQAEVSTVACAGGCGAQVWKRGHKPATGLCPKCLGVSRRTAPHGSETRYNRGCRCDLCRSASAASRRRRRHANPEATRAYERARYYGRKAVA